MKARIKKTGEIVDIAKYARITVDKYDSWGNLIEVKPEDVELIQEQTEDEHWQDIRERAAIAAMQGLSANTKLFYENSEEKIDVTARAIRYANALIEKLKRK